MFRIPVSRKIIVSVLLSLLALPVLNSCATVTGGKADLEALGEAVDKFHMSIRWEEYKAASMFIPQQQRKQFWDDMDLFQRRVRVMDFKVRDILAREGSWSAEVIVQCRFYHTNDPQLHTKTLQQEWRYMEKGKVWLVTRHDLESLILHNAPE